MRTPLLATLALCLLVLPTSGAGQSPQGTTPPGAGLSDPVSAPANPAPDATVAAGADITVNTRRTSQTPPSLFDPIAPTQLDVPTDLLPAAPGARASAGIGAGLPTGEIAPVRPAGPMTPVEIAKQIAPNFDVARDYTRLVQCYGTADFMGAVTRIQASRPGAPAQVIGVARQIAALTEAMQPMVLATSTVRGEPRFRADYDAFARRGQYELATSRTPNTTMQRRLATLDACKRDVARWRGGR